MKVLASTNEVMDALGGNVAIAHLTGRTPHAVWNWRQSKTFPANTYIIIHAELERLGLKASADLWPMKPHRSLRADQSSFRRETGTPGSPTPARARGAFSSTPGTRR